MEYALRYSEISLTVKRVSLNPYYNGICSTSCYDIEDIEREDGLNPYSNGICSTSDPIHVKIFRNWLS